MNTHKDQRDRTLLLARILYEETDRAHPISLANLTAKLHEKEVGGERKSIYKDLAALQKYGMEIVFKAGKFGGWYLEKRIFTIEQLVYLQDAIAVYPCISGEERQTISEGLKLMTSLHQREKLNRPVRIFREYHSEEESMRKLLGDIYRSIHGEQLINFTVYEYDSERQHLTKVRHSMVPHGILWENSSYYLFGWERQEGTVTLYPLDRVRDILNLGLHNGDPVSDWSTYLDTNFGHRMDSIERLHFYCKQKATDEVLRQFGEETELKREGDGFTFSAKVQIGPAFWGFMVAHSEVMTVISPTWRAKQWREEYRPRIKTVLIDPLEGQRFIMYP